MKQCPKFYTQDLIAKAIAGDRKTICTLYSLNERLAGQGYKMYKTFRLDYYKGILWELLSCKLHLFQKLMLQKDRKLSTWVLGHMRKAVSRDIKLEENLIHVPNNIKHEFIYTPYQDRKDGRLFVR